MLGIKIWLIIAMLLTTPNTSLSNQDIMDIEAKVYPVSGIVTDVSYSEDLVIFERCNGNRFAFYGCDDWAVGDICSAIMSDNGTPYVTDDIVLYAIYDGRKEWLPDYMELLTDGE